jgi:integrase
MTENNPVRTYPKRHLRESRPRTRILIRNEQNRLILASKAYMRLPIRFALATGLRLEEQLSLTWGQINFQKKEIFIPETKSGSPRTIPLTEEARKALDQISPVTGSPYVFCNKDGRRYQRFTRGFNTAVKRAGLIDVQWHDLRRTCGSQLLNDGNEMILVSRWLGHKSIAVTERGYAFLAPESLHKAAQKSDQARRIEAEQDAKNGEKMVPRGGIEPPTRGFSVHCSTN